MESKSNILVCPYCGNMKETFNPLEIHTCSKCNVKYKPTIKHENIKPGILTCKGVIVQGVSI